MPTAPAIMPNRSLTPAQSLMALGKCRRHLKNFCPPTSRPSLRSPRGSRPTGVATWRKPTRRSPIFATMLHRLSAETLRGTALGQLALQLPPPVLARLTGLSKATATRLHATVSAGNARNRPTLSEPVVKKKTDPVAGRTPLFSYDTESVPAQPRSASILFIPIGSPGFPGASPCLGRLCS